MREITGGEATLLAGRVSAHGLKVEVKNAVGTWIDYSDFLDLDWQDRAEIRIDVDNRVAEAIIELARETEEGSLSPLINTEIAAGRAIRISGSRVAVGAGFSQKEIFLGRIDRVSWTTNPMVLVARDDTGVLVDRWIEDETEYSLTGGRAMEAVMQDILNDWAPSLFTLYTPTSPSAPVNPYRQQKQSIYDAHKALADLIGWVLEYRWDNGTGTFRYTLYEPDRTPSGTVWTFGPDDYYNVTRLDQDSLNVRNAITVRYTDAATGLRGRYDVEDPTSIAQYGRLWAEFEEADDSPIDSAAKAAALGDAALSDLAWPVADQEIECDFFWPVQLGDPLGFLPNGKHYTVAQEFAVTGYTHVFEQGRAVTLIRTRGTPVGHTEGWLKRESRPRSPEEIAIASQILNFREISRTQTEVTYGWTLGTDLSESWIHDYLEEQPYSNDRWPGPNRMPDTVTDDREVEYTVAIPEQGFIRYFQVEGRRSDSSLGDMERALIFPLGDPGDYIAFAAITVNQSDGSAIITGWSTDRARSVAYAYNVGLAAVTDPPTEAQTELQGFGATGGGLVTGFTSDFEIVLPAETLQPGEVIKVLLIAYLNANGTGPDGTAQDHDTPVGVQGERFKITRSDQIENLIVTANKLTESSRHFGFNGVFSAVDWDTVQWTAGSLLLAGPVTFTIGSGSVNLPDDDLVFIYFDKAVSTTTLQTTDSMATATQGEGKILIAAVKRAPSNIQEAAFYPAVGQLGLNEDNLGVNSISTNTLQANSVTAVKANIATLSSLTANVGLLFAGIIQNGDGTVVIDLDAEGSEPFIDADDFRLFADGSAEFAGVITASVAVLQGGLQVDQDTLLLGVFQHDGDFFGAFGTTAIAKPTVSGARDDPEAGLKNFLQAIENLGLINDTTTAT